MDNNSWVGLKVNCIFKNKSQKEIFHGVITQDPPEDFTIITLTDGRIVSGKDVYFSLADANDILK